ncbi:myosin-3-like [Bradysia coprophila]|uniref:myosin-3-like n=1 Tax=Bradysia coprophila TaxID=38358 RepID=UPI00187DA12F|nr:myosin-3-like [Bradysia coprophila]
MNFETLATIAAILLCPVELNATQNGGKRDFDKLERGRHWNGRNEGKHRSTSPGSSSSHFDRGGREESTETFFPNEGSAGQTTTTKTITTSSTSSATLIGGEIIGTSKEKVVLGGHDYICDCSGCVQHTYELTDDDLSFVNITVIATVHTDVQVQNCGILLTKLRNDYEQLTNKVITVDSFISALTKEKNSVVSDLKKCRGKNALITDDLLKVTTELKNVKKKLQDTIDDSAKLKTQWVSVTADSEKWKTKSDSLEIDLKRALDSNGLLTITVNEYSTTIANLRSTINEITIKNNMCGNDSNEWKRKWETENSKVVTNEKRIKELEATNNDLTSRITKLTIDLTSCRNGNAQNDKEINKLKDTVTDLTKQLSKCTVDLGSCNDVLNRVTNEFNADKLQDVEAAKLRAKIELELGECVNRKKEVEQNLETERKAVDKCKAEVVTMRNECSTRYKKFEDDIIVLKSNNQISIDKCQATLKSEIDINVNSRTEITVLKNQITDFETKLSVSIKNSEDWQKRNQFCEDDSINLKQKIESLQTNVADVNQHLTTCVTNANSLQIDITSCQSKRDVCTDDLERTKKKLVDSELVIVNLNINVSSLETARKTCQTELSTLRCDVDQYLRNTKSAQEKVNVAVLQVLSFLDTDKKFLGDFIDSHDTTCKI